VSKARGDRADLDREGRHQRTIQRNRAFLFTFAWSLAMPMRFMGLTYVPLKVMVLFWATGVATAFAFWLFYRLDLHHRFQVSLVPVSLFTDVVLISVAVYLSGGADSVWFPWYLANMSAAAFLRGQLAAFLVALADTAGYLVALVLYGDIGGFDEVFFTALMIMAGMYAASFFFLRGAVDVRRKSRQVRQLREEDGRKMVELARANLELHEAAKVKSRFLTNMSHELRTPLNSIIGFAEILRTRLSGELGETHLRFLSHIHSAGEHLLGIINDLLDLAKIEAGTLELRPELVDVATSLETVCDIIRGAALGRHVELETPESPLPKIELDRVRFKQIVLNLVSNAVEYSPPESTVRLAVSLHPATASPLAVNAIAVRVIDQGIGIDPSHHELIFEQFRQVDGGDDRVHEGTGLGLTLVKRFVELHGGQVRVESAPRGGSTFTVWLPVAFQGAAEGSPARTA